MLIDVRKDFKKYPSWFQIHDMHRHPYPHHNKKLMAFVFNLGIAGWDPEDFTFVLGHWKWKSWSRTCDDSRSLNYPGRPRQDKGWEGWVRYNPNLDRWTDGDMLEKLALSFCGKKQVSPVLCVEGTIMEWMPFFKLIQILSSVCVQMQYSSYRPCWMAWFGAPSVPLIQHEEWTSTSSIWLWEKESLLAHWMQFVFRKMSRSSQIRYWCFCLIPYGQGWCVASLSCPKLASSLASWSLCAARPSYPKSSLQMSWMCESQFLLAGSLTMASACCAYFSFMGNVFTRPFGQVPPQKADVQSLWSSFLTGKMIPCFFSKKSFIGFHRCRSGRLGRSGWKFENMFTSCDRSFFFFLRFIAPLYRSPLPQ